jgi:transposase-like protein
LLCLLVPRRFAAKDSGGFTEETMLDFPLADFMDEQVCYQFLLQLLHPDGLGCPRCGKENYRVHRRNRAPVLDYRCSGCGRIFNCHTQTLLHKTHKTPSQWVLILRGISQGATTNQLSRELGLSYGHLLDLRHKLQGWLEQQALPKPLTDSEVEVDEMYQNAGKKRGKARVGHGQTQTARQSESGSWHLEEGSSADPWNPGTHQQAIGAQGVA